MVRIGERRRSRARTRVVGAFVAAAFLTGYTPAIAQAPTGRRRHHRPLALVLDTSRRPTPSSRAASPSPAAGSRPSSCTSTAPGSWRCPRVASAARRSTPGRRSPPASTPWTAGCSRATKPPAPSPSTASWWPQPGETVRGTVQVKGGGPSYELPARVATSGTPPAGVIPAPALQPRLPQRRRRRPRQGPQLLEARPAPRTPPTTTTSARSPPSSTTGASTRRPTRSWSPVTWSTAGGAPTGATAATSARSTPRRRSGVAHGAGGRHLLPAVAASASPSDGLDVLPAMGDHEYGDDPWPRAKRERARAFEEEYAEHLGRLPEKFAKQGQPSRRASTTHARTPCGRAPTYS